jgi:putative transposase
MKDYEAYKALPAKVAQQVLRVLDKNWQSFFAALATWRLTPRSSSDGLSCQATRTSSRAGTCSSLPARPSAFRRCALAWSVHPCWASRCRRGSATSSRCSIIPRSGFYGVEVVHEREPVPAAVNPSLHAGVASGLNHLAVLTADKAGFVPHAVNGRPVQSNTPFDNKRRAELQSLLETMGTSRRLERITTNRTRRIDHYLHTASHRIIALLVAEGIGMFCIGKNPLWKQEAHLGRRTKQHFVSVPHARFIARLTYKAELMGMQVRLTEESYTSKASFLDADPLPVYGAADIPAFSDKRVKRGLYRAADGRHRNADANGSYNMIRKAAPEACAQGSSGCVVHPIRLAV